MEALATLKRLKNELGATAWDALATAEKQRRVREALQEEQPVEIQVEEDEAALDEAGEESGSGSRRKRRRRTPIRCEDSSNCAQPACVKCCSRRFCLTHFHCTHHALHAEKARIFDQRQFKRDSPAIADTAPLDAPADPLTPYNNRRARCACAPSQACATGALLARRSSRLIS